MFRDLLQNCCCESVPRAPLNVALTTLLVIFAKTLSFSAQNFNDRKLSYKYFYFHKFFWNCSSAHVGYVFENHALLFCWKSKFFLHKFQNWLKKTIFQRLISPIFFLSSRWLAVWHTWLKKFAKRQRNHSNLKIDNRKMKLFRTRIIFFLKKFLWKREFLLYERRTFRVKALFFLISKSVEGWYQVHFSKKNVIPQNIAKVLRL